MKKHIAIYIFLMATLAGYAQVETVSIGELPEKDTIVATDMIFVEDDSAYSYHASVASLLQYFQDSISASIPLISTATNYTSRSGSVAVAFVDLHIWNDTLFLGSAVGRDGDQVYVARTDYENSVVIQGTPGIYYKSAGYTQLLLSKTMTGCLVQSDGTAWYMIGIFYDPYYRSTLAVFPDSLSIGTYSPTAKLSVSGNINYTDYLYRNGSPYLYNYYRPGTVGWNLFLGNKAGNTSLTGSTGEYGCYNLAIGDSSLTKVTRGKFNIAIGMRALKEDTSGVNNIGIGYNALGKNTSGYSNVAVGVNALSKNTYAYSNVAIGNYCMQEADSNVTSVAVGMYAMRYAKTGSCNVAVGAQALHNARHVLDCIAIGSNSLEYMIDAEENISVGVYGQYKRKDGDRNVSIGNHALYSDTTGQENLAIGNLAGFKNNGSGNIFIGYKAGANQLNVSNRLFFSNDSNKTLIYGNMAEDSVKVGGNLEITKNFTIPRSTDSTGAITQEGVSIFHTYPYSAGNLFIGEGAGNFTMSGSGENIGIGLTALDSLTTGDYNIAIGSRSGIKQKTGSYNIYIGKDAGASSTDDDLNLYIGHEAGQNNSAARNMAVGYAALKAGSGSFNIAIGEESLISAGTSQGCTSTGFMSGHSIVNQNDVSLYGVYSGRYLNGKNNSFFGAYSGYGSSGNTTGEQNTLVGGYSGYYLRSGENNCALGYSALFSNSANGLTGSANVAVGSFAGYQNRSGANNIYIGLQSGYSNLTGSGNIFIGYQAGYSSTGSNELIIGNTSTSKLIHGDFNTNQLWLNGLTQIGGTESSHAYTLFVNGTCKISDYLLLQPNSAAPGSPAEGMIYYDSDDHHAYIYNGSTWVCITD